jgi:RNA polymerase sigma-54 factor
VQLQRQGLVQEQHLKLSPQMLQTILLMTLPVQDLVEKIQEEIEKNPALEIIEDKRAVSLDDIPERDTEVENYFDSTSDAGFRPGPSGGVGDDDAKRMFLEGAVSRPETLQDHLLWQLRLQPLSPAERAIGERIIGNLNPDGFHEEPLENVFRATELPLVHRVQAIIQGFEPMGCCVANYEESLLVQTAQRPDAPDDTAAVIKKGLSCIERGPSPEIARKLKLNLEDLVEIVDFIKTLTPYPGRLYSAAETRYVVPDILVRQKDGEFIIILNDEEIPVLGIAPFFEAQSVAAKAKGKPTRPNGKAAAEYVRENVRSARSFIQSVQMRNQTVIKVAKALVGHQRNFFLHGPKYLVPLTLKDIAEEIHVHETTVSRISRKKYMQTEWGIFELKYFFTNSISGTGSGGSPYSKGGVKEVIREIIKNETSRLSDQAISEMLAMRGIKLARRTVAKYRNELKVNASYER